MTNRPIYTKLIDIAMTRRKLLHLFKGSTWDKDMKLNDLSLRHHRLRPIDLGDSL